MVFGRALFRNPLGDRVIKSKSSMWVVPRQIETNSRRISRKDFTKSSRGPPGS